MSLPPVYHIFDKGQAQGPFPMSEIARKWTTNEISGDALYFTEGWPDWKPLISSTEMAAFFKPAKKPESELNVLILIVITAVIFIGLFIGALYGDSHGWWILPVIDFSPGKVMVGLFALLAGITVVGNELGKPNGVWRSISFVVIFGFLLKGCVFTDRTHEERPPVSASSSEAHDYRDGFNIGLEVGKKNGRPGSGYSIPTKEGLFQLSAFALMGHSPSDKQEFMRGWRDGYKLGFQQTSEKAF